MSTGQLSRRSYKLIVAPYDTDEAKVALGTGKDLSALDIQFKVKRTLKAKPNTAVIRVWGLKRETRQFFSTPKKLALSLEAGYNDTNELLFLGETRNAFSEQEGPEIVTTFETGDSEKVMAAAGLSLTFSQPQLTLEQAFNALSQNIPQVISPSMSKQLWAQSGVLGQITFPVLYPKPGAMDRSAARFLNDICRAAGLQWSRQNESILILPLNGTYGKEVVLNAKTGLIGSPFVDNKGLLEVKSLIQPGLRPGAKIQLQGVEIKGHYRVEEAEYQGHSAPGQKEWYCKMRCTKLG